MPKHNYYDGPYTGGLIWYYIHDVCKMLSIPATDVPVFIESWLLRDWFHNRYAIMITCCEKMINLTAIDSPEFSQSIQSIRKELGDVKQKVFRSLESIQEVEMDEQGMIKMADFSWWLFCTVKKWRVWIVDLKTEYWYRGENNDVWVLVRILLGQLNSLHYEMGVLLTFINEVQGEKDRAE